MVNPRVHEAAASSSTSPAARATCDLSTLRGTYLFYDQGVDETGNTFAGAGLEYFDGNGNIYGVFSHHDHGQVSTARNEPYTATYTVNADCTGTSTYDGEEYDLFIHPGGDMFTWVLTTPPDSDGVSGLEQRVSHQRVG
jgi:hypothetical protein